MKDKVYIAGPFFTSEQVSIISQIEGALELANIDYFSPRSKGRLIDIPSAADRKVIFQDLFDSNIKNIEDCNCMIAVIDKHDVGTIFEFGWAACLHKKIITLSTKGHGLNLMLACTAFKHTNSVADAVRAIKPADRGEPTIPVT